MPSPAATASRILQWLNPGPTTTRRLKLLGILLLGLLVLFTTLLTIHRGLLPLLAWIIPGLRRGFWDLAVYGAYPTEGYVSFGLRGPETNVVRWDETCDDGGLVLVSPYGPSTPHEGPMILDARGDLVYTTKSFATTMNFRMQRFRGKNCLTFWAGTKQGALGTGAYYILDEAYNIVKTVRAVGQGLKGDMHEFEITEDGTALITLYAPRQADMRAMGLYRPEDGWIMDSMFQEIDIETGQLLFEWRASDHFRPEETFYSNPFAGRWENNPFDFYHINSMQKDGLGNFIVSSRHLHTVSYINGSNGDVEWTLGGDYEDFDDLSDGHASDFRWQHHAHWFSEEERILSLFDNQAAGPLHEDAPYSKGMLVQLDLENMTARLLQSYVSIGQTRAASQGAVQLLEPTDHVFVGWGSSAAYTEFDIAGEPLCETHLAAESTFWWERVKSYRAYKVFDWVGRPDFPPDAVIQGSRLYVSWNGGTGVGFWELQGSRYEEPLEEGGHVDGESERPEWESVEMIEKAGFEGVFDLSTTTATDREYVRFRVAALDEEKMYIRYSGTAKTISRGSGVVAVLCGILVTVGCIAGVWICSRVRARRRRGSLHGTPVFTTASTTSAGGIGTWELGSIGRVFSRARAQYEYSKLPE